MGNLFSLTSTSCGRLVDRNACRTLPTMHGLCASACPHLVVSAGRKGALFKGRSRERAETLVNGWQAQDERMRRERRAERQSCSAFNAEEDPTHRRMSGRFPEVIRSGVGGLRHTRLEPVPPVARGLNNRASLPGAPGGSYYSRLSRTLHPIERDMYSFPAPLPVSRTPI
jgi:hypothetical protein